LARIAATLAIAVGTVIVGFSPNRWDRVVVDLPRGHGIHLHELIGVAFIAFGVAVFWRSSVPPSSCGMKRSSAQGFVRPSRLPRRRKERSG
jgi:hypothetical protein